MAGKLRIRITHIFLEFLRITLILFIYKLQPCSNNTYTDSWKNPDFVNLHSNIRDRLHSLFDLRSVNLFKVYKFE